MRNNILKKTIFASAIGAAVLVGVSAVSAQNTSEEYREWQAAQRRAQEEYRDYQRTRSRSDYRDWQQAQRQAQQEYAEYRRTAGRNNRYTNRSGGSRFYRVNRGGRYYQTDSRGVELLRQAVNRGYQQGYNAGVRDRRYDRNDSYYSNNTIYRSGTYGYQTGVARDQYQYYFQQGFQRGYQDGINSRQQYGYRSGSTWNILGNVLNSILSIDN
jgi:hypothetical protein